MIEIVRATPRDRDALALLFQRIDDEQPEAERGTPDTAVRGLDRSLRSFDARAGYLFVDELYVLASHRRRGAAKGLLDRVGALAAELGLHGVRLLVRPENADARALYDPLGFAAHVTGLREKRLAKGDAA